jgi:hypothetical protein
MNRSIRKWRKVIAIACMCLSAGSPVQASEQVLSCAPLAADGPEIRVLISERMFSKGVILWPSQAGTTVFEIREKTAVSYTAAQTAKAEAAGPGGSVYINRLNGQLRFRAPPVPELAGTIAKLCRGAISREECAETLGSSSVGASVCFASVDCTKMEHNVGPIEASYNCKRSFKKF